MKLSTFTHTLDGGWSLPQFPALDSQQTVVMIFAAPEYLDHPAAISELAAAYPNSTLIGCSTSGEIAGPWVNDASLSVAVARFEHTRIASASVEIGPAGNSFSAGAALARKLTGDGLRNVFVLSDGLHVNGSELVNGLTSILPPQVVITGGLAGDGDRFQRTWLIAGGAPRTGLITAVGFYGDRLCITHGSRGGWDAFGPERRITRASGNILYELDGRPALALYKEYLGERAAGLPATGLLFPLSIRRTPEDNRPLVRTILAVDEESQSMTFAGDVPKDYLAQLMRANFDRLVNGASVAADHATALLTGSLRTGSGYTPQGPVLAVSISCVGRRLVLGERTEEETEATLEHLPAGAQQVGFYSYGEISPCTTGSCDLHNQTMTITTFSEE
ncbi:MAG TPA: FIST N-terminal domain-containing protein [Paucimonas sp.]|nr:FIST N-terminal domain-containing protein [Paucimonas sp.]